MTALDPSLFTPDHDRRPEALSGRPALAFWSDVWRRFRQNTPAMASVVLLVPFALLAIRNINRCLESNGIYANESRSNTFVSILQLCKRILKVTSDVIESTCAKLVTIIVAERSLNSQVA